MQKLILQIQLRIQILYLWFSDTGQLSIDLHVTFDGITQYFLGLFSIFWVRVQFMGRRDT